MKANRFLLGGPTPRVIALMTLLFTGWACSAGDTVPPEDDSDDTTTATTTTTTTTSTGGGMDGAGGSGGGEVFPCGQDCSLIDTPQCLQSVCNDGSYPGAIGSCVVVPEDAGVACDDGLFCTAQDACDGNGACMGGPQNTCGMTAPACQEITCDEVAKTCGTQNKADGEMCTSTDLCQTGATCTAGQCVGTTKDCFFAPVPNECFNSVCNPMNGICEPLAANDGEPCVDSMDLCSLGNTCNAGVCSGGFQKDCSAFDNPVGCIDGVCDPMTGTCGTQQVAVGMPCNAAADSCNTGTCDMNQNCVAVPVADGTMCTDFNSCTTGNTCQSGVCGTVDPLCTTLFEQNFESCPPAGWIVNGGVWECGAPGSSGPTTAQQGTSILGTGLNSLYPNSMSYTNDYAQTPPIDLSQAVTPELSWYQWMDTEGGPFDGYNVKISTDNGQTFQVLNTVNPPYNLTVDGQAAYGGDESTLGWNLRTADLTSFIGNVIVLRFSMRTDSSVQDAGVFIDDVKVEETSGPGVPVVITTASPLSDAVEGLGYVAQLQRTGGTPAAVWSIEPGGTNDGWLSINPATGQLTGTPAIANLGPVSTTIRLEESPTNFTTKTFTFNVITAVYFEAFDGGCPAGWTLNGTWQCGAPTSGPNVAYSGANAIATNLAGLYSNNLTFAADTASSGPISLVGATAPLLKFWVWYDTEGRGFDGWNVKVSTDGGNTYSIATLVTPAYNLTVSGQQAWGGDMSASGWQEYQVDLTPYIGQTINLQFGIRTDGSVTDLGVYIDDVGIFD